uniref:NADH-ubiquinone oxidoreductase chain 5 n=1 Tax=Isoetes engelmannii TaxID=37427 RepID=C6G8G5_ISOEN|nr:NADH dehydrogenase subunit 5 [Isoetes engelmannii]
MYLLIVSSPSPGSSVAGAPGRFPGSRGTAIVTTTRVPLSSIFPSIAFSEVALGAGVRYIKIVPRISPEMFDVPRGSSSDSLTVVTSIVVTLVSSLVHLYLISHTSEDPHSPRFMCYLPIPILFTPMLVTGDNSLQLLPGWEGVGLALYSSINLRFTRLQANKAAIKAMLVNRVGDFGSALGMMGCFTLSETVDSPTLFARASPNHYSIFCDMRSHATIVIRILLSPGAVGKSAQMGLHTRSPDAMEGPTPVSVLIHAATTATAGVPMIARRSPSSEYSPDAPIAITSVGAMTSFPAATTGISQNDLKRVIAHPTRSQSGYMIFARGILNYCVSVSHSMNHAPPKASPSSSAGSVTHATSDEQDMRKMGGLASLSPFTYAMMLIGILPLIGFPFFTGFHPKDVISELAYTKRTTSGHSAFRSGSVSVFFTPHHSFRLLFLTPSAPTNPFSRDILRCHDAPILTAIPPILLAFGSLFAGYLAKDMIGLGTNSRANSPFILPRAESEFATPTIIKPIPILSSTPGAPAAYNVNLVAKRSIFASKTGLGNQLHRSLNKRRYFDKVSNDFLVGWLLRLGHEVSSKALDKGAIEILGPPGISYTSRILAREISKLQSGSVYYYALVTSPGSTIFMTIIGPWDFLCFRVDNRSYLLYIYLILHSTRIN